MGAETGPCGDGSNTESCGPNTGESGGATAGGNRPYLSPPPPPAVPDPDSSRREDGGGRGSWVAPARTVPRLRKLLPSEWMERSVDPTLRTRTGGLGRADLPLASPGPQCGRGKGEVRGTWRNGPEGPTPGLGVHLILFINLLIQFIDCPHPRIFLLPPVNTVFCSLYLTLLFMTHCF